MKIFSKESHDTLIIENISEEFTKILESSFDTISTINSYMIESSTIINESGFSDTVKLLFDSVIRFIKKIYHQFIGIFMKQSEYVNYMLDRYSESIKNLTDQDLKDIKYEYKEFNFPKNIPVFGHFKSVQKLIDGLSGLKIGIMDLNYFKYSYGESLDLLRGEVLGIKNTKISEQDFVGRLKKIFRGSDEIFVKKLTKEGLDNMIKGIMDYKDVKKMIETDKDNILKEYERYSKIVSEVINIKYSTDSFGAILSTSSGKQISTDILTVNIYKDYQSLTASFLAQILEIYSIVYREKLSALKDKYDMEIELLKKIIRLVV
jgi:hypothetical protein